jgi:hypothetical protein
MPQGITFGILGGGSIKFSEPVLLDFATFPTVPGLYAILERNASCKPRPFRLLYIGMTSNLADRPSRSHENFDDWCREASGGCSLYASYHAMEGSSIVHRTIRESSLVQYNRPPCNKNLGTTAHVSPSRDSGQLPPPRYTSLSSLLAAPTDGGAKSLLDMMLAAQPEPPKRNRLVEAILKAQKEREASKPTTLADLLGRINPPPRRKFLL